MAINRNRSLIPVRSNYLPQQYIPNFEMMAGAITAQQQAYDQALALGEKVPKHIQQDFEAVQKYVGGVRTKIDELSKMYADQGVSAGNRARRELLTSVARDWQPGGSANRFEQRLNTYQQSVKQIEEQYKDDPRIAQFYKGRIKVNPYDDITSPNYGIGSPTMDRIYNTKELNDIYDKVLGNISADQVVKGPYLDRKTLAGVSFKDLLVQGKTKFIDFNKVASALAQATPTDVLASEEVKGLAYGLGEGQSQVLDLTEEGKAQVDEKGRIKFADTSLGRMLRGFAEGKAFTEQDVDTKIVSDTFGESKALKDIDLQNLIGLTEPYNIDLSTTLFGGADGIQFKNGELIAKGSGKAKYEKINKELTKAVEDNDITWWNNPALHHTIVGNKISNFFAKFFAGDDKVDTSKPEIQNTMSVLEANGTLTSDMTDEQKTRAFGEVIDNYLQRPTRSAQITPIVDADYQRDMNQILFSKQDLGKGESDLDRTQGYISNMLLTDKHGNELSGKQLKDKMAKTDRSKMNLEAEVRAPESLLPFGTRIVQLGDDEYQAAPLISDKIKPEFIMNMSYRAKNEILDGFSVTEDMPALPNDPKLGIIPQYINQAGTYKLEYTPEGENIYRKEGTGFKKLNDKPLEITQ